MRFVAISTIEIAYLSYPLNFYDAKKSACYPLAIEVETVKVNYDH